MSGVISRYPVRKAKNPGVAAEEESEKAENTLEKVAAARRRGVNSIPPSL